MSKPSDRASDLMSTIDDAHAKLKRAWRSRPDGDLQTGRPEAGRITSSRVPDPASDAAATVERLRRDVLSTVCDLTAELAETDAVGADPSPVFLCKRLDDMLALHRQYSGQLLTRIRQLETPTGWDDAKSLTSTLASHAQQIHRTAQWAYGTLAQPDADPSLRVCDDDQCQRPAHENSLLCKTHIDRRDRAQAKAEQRRRQIRADRANGLRCMGEIDSDCEAMLTERERDNERRNCGQCRTPRCAAEIRTDCTRPLTDDDIARNATNCSGCRKWDHDERQRQAKRAAERATDGTVAFRYQDV